MIAQSIHINGIVQGVGFRPFVARLARKLRLGGWVQNSADGVHILAQGNREQLHKFEASLCSDAPQAAQILSMQIKQCNADENFSDHFDIVTSAHDTSRDTLISPDIATCPECVKELFDKNDRRYHYPFINCTNCGPRFTIIKDLPYDRTSTAMSEFKMCESCANEYKCENDRRYHAQPDACFECGPALWWQKGNEFIQAHNLESSDALLERAAHALLSGEIVAIKGLGGWHLACDATNYEAVARLRKRKKRPDKPLAIMLANIDAAKALCEISQDEAFVLEGSVRPIVLCKRKSEAVCAHADGRAVDDDRRAVGNECECVVDSECAYNGKPASADKNSPTNSRKQVAQNIAFELPELGIMLPSTPVQHLLFALIDRPLVMTSANLSGEPIVAKDEDALNCLSLIADAYLGNNREIVARYDDSVMRIIDGGAKQVVRRARGLAPTPLIETSAQIGAASQKKDATQGKTATKQAATKQATPEQTTTKQAAPAPVIFAAGPQQKSTFCFLRSTRAYISQHLGDLENLGAWNAYKEAFAHYSHLFSLKPQIIACDKHPEYISSKWAREYAAQHSLPIIEVQHHHAHIASVMGEHGIYEPIIGIALDGTGAGNDGTIWGGEILIATRSSFTREWHLPQIPLLGADAAIKDPRRIAYSLLRTHGKIDDPQFDTFLEALKQREILEQIYNKKLNSPLCSSAGRYFDGVAALLGLCDKVSYDGQAACLLEAQAQKELALGQSCDKLTALGFHKYLAQTVVNQCITLKEEHSINNVALSGGCMVNRLLFKLLKDQLTHAGFNIYTNIALPPNDGCIAYGQAIVAKAQLLE